MNKSVIQFLPIPLLSFLLLFTAAHSQSNIQADSVKFEKSIAVTSLDFSRHDFQKDGEISITGDWEFYWQKLLTPEDFNVKQSPELIKVPGSWHRQTEHPSLGYATYRTRLILPKDQGELSIYFPYINSSSKVWVDGKVVAETGHVSSDRKEYKSGLTNLMISLPGEKEELEIIIQVANYSYFSAGVSGSPTINKTNALFHHIEITNGIENFFAGSLMAMFIYQMILYFLIGREKPYLWLALICISIALRSMIVHGGSFLLPSLLPWIDWEYWKKIEFGGVYGVIAFFPLYVYHLFPNYAPKKPIIFFVGIASAMGITVVFSPQYIYGYLLEVCHFMLLLTFAYAIYSITKAWKAKVNSDAKIILFGILAAFPFILAEIVKNSVLFYPLQVNFMYMVELGLLIFLLFQVYLLANHYAMAYKNLEVLNLNLEKKVSDRTSQLSTSNTVKDRLLSVMSHDIKSPLNSLRGILQIYNKGTITQAEFGEFARHLENDLSKTNLLVENIVYWTASQLKGVQVRREKFDLSILIDEIFQLFQTIAADKKIVIQHDVPRNFIIYTDRNILNFVIRNLVANAAKFSFEGGNISILVSYEKGDLLIRIKDTGTGMDESTVASLLRPDRLLSAAGTNNEKGTGLGVALCLDYLQKSGGRLSVESILGKGSMFTITLPADTGSST